MMTQSELSMPDDKIVSTMIELARCTSHHRIILAGSSAPQCMLELHRRGYTRVATTANRGLPRGQYDIALVEWQAHSIKALETTLTWLVDFLGTAGVLAIWVDARKCSSQRKLRLMLEGLGFRVEAGTRCENGIVISARRQDARPHAIAA